jgi:co-chaperonin GroES (HSP10)
MKSATLHKVSEPQYDPRRELLEKLGDLSHLEIAQNEVLLAIYMRPEKTTGGIVLPQQNLKEDRYQGKCGLVVKIGSACRFVRQTADTGVEYGINIKLHDWVVVRPSDTWALDINSDVEGLQIQDFVQCRLVYDDQIRMRVADPRVIW